MRNDGQVREPVAEFRPHQRIGRAAMHGSEIMPQFVGHDFEPFVFRDVLRPFADQAGTDAAARACRPSAFGRSVCWYWLVKPMASTAGAGLTFVSNSRSDLREIGDRIVRLPHLDGDDLQDRAAMLLEDFRGLGDPLAEFLLPDFLHGGLGAVGQNFHGDFQRACGR